MHMALAGHMCVENMVTNNNAHDQLILLFWTNN